MTEQKKSKMLHTGLWVAQVLLALAFGMAGSMKLTMPTEELTQKGMTFVSHYQAGTVRFIGSMEILAAIGLILPAALRRLPILTPMAATGLALVMALATQYHISHHEPAVANIVLLLLAVFIAWGRFVKAPVVAKA